MSELLCIYTSVSCTPDSYCIYSIYSTVQCYACNAGHKVCFSALSTFQFLQAENGKKWGVYVYCTFKIAKRRNRRTYSVSPLLVDKTTALAVLKISLRFLCTFSYIQYLICRSQPPLSMGRTGFDYFNIAVIQHLIFYTICGVKLMVQRCYYPTVYVEKN